MNVYPRGSHYLGHLISGINHHYICGECRSLLVYACGSATETLTCIQNPLHTGLMDKQDGRAEDVLKRQQAVNQFVALTNGSLLDEGLRSYVQQRSQRSLNNLFGDDND